MVLVLVLQLERPDECECFFKRQHVAGVHDCSAEPVPPPLPPDAAVGQVWFLGDVLGPGAALAPYCPLLLRLEVERPRRVNGLGVIEPALVRQQTIPLALWYTVARSYTIV